MFYLKQQAGLRWLQSESRKWHLSLIRQQLESEGCLEDSVCVFGNSILELLASSSRYQSGGNDIETNSEEKFASFLSILGLLSGLFASLNQIIRLWPKHEIEEENGAYQDLVEDLSRLEAEIANLKRALAQIEASTASASRTEADSGGTEA